MKRLIRFTTFLLSVISVSILAISCAKQGFPSGGPKDVQPPVAGVANPPSATTNFTAKEFYIPFDEYVVVKDAENNILVSPPMAKKPEYTPKGRGLLVKLKDTLLANTTYLFQFKGAIADLNEGNALDSYEYAFSTGSILDSMTLKGSVKDALTLKPREETVTVMLYTSDKDDSVVVKETPKYITRCDKNGNFEFNNIADGDYRILAIEDGDRNMKLGKDEAMAFSDTMVIAKKKIKIAESDTTTKDSTNLTKPKLPKPASQPSVGAQLLMTKSDKEAQRITGSNFIRNGKIQIITHRPMKHCNVEVLTCDTCKTEEIEWHLNSKGDTLLIWTLREACDSIALIVQDGDEMIDTLKLKVRKKPNRRNPKATPPKVSLIKATNQSSTPFFDTIRFGFENPIASIANADSTIEVMLMKDSSIVYRALRLSEDKLHGWADMELVQGEKYKLTIYKDAIKDIYGNGNDTTQLETEVTKASQYGNIFITVGEDSLKLETEQVIFELLSEDNKVIKTVIAQGPQKVAFKNLLPNKYKIRAIMDSDANGKWDVGDYWMKRQPEKVVYYEKTLDLRANWDIEERW